jgi:hypothetical protein
MFVGFFNKKKYKKCINDFNVYICGFSINRVRTTLKFMTTQLFKHAGGSIKFIFLHFTIVIICFFVFLPKIHAQTATAPSTGTGTSSNPYQIATLDNLYWIYANTSEWNKHYIQTADINASATSTWNSSTGWMPIGNTTTKFTGTYNGQGFEISGLRINRTGSDYQGLFGDVSNAILINIKLTSANIAGRSFVGGIAGRALLTYINRCEINSSTISGTTDFVGGWVGDHTYTTDSILIRNQTISLTISGRNVIGGVFGRTASAIFFENVNRNGNTTGTGTHAGGLIGHASYSAATYSPQYNACSNTGTISTSGSFVGGLVGLIAKGTIIGCSNSGNITSTGAGYVGGFVGQGLNLYINRCTNTATTIRGNLGASGSYIGSWVGDHTYSDSIYLVGFTNASTVQGYSHAGGFFGRTSAPIFFTDCHNTGGITLSGANSVSSYAGGLVGQSTYNQSTYRSTYINCSNIGAINTQGGFAGGLVGGLLKGYMIGCVNSGNVISSGNGYVGGFVGQGLNLYINRCTNTATTIRGNLGASGSYIGSWVGDHTYSDSINLVGFTNASTVQGYSHAGGFFGQTNAPIFFTDCHNTGGITLSGANSVSSYAGGLVGNFAYPANGSFLPMIKDCSNAGAISAQGGLAGGLAGGVAKGYMIGCSNSGNVISSDGGYVGGFVGQGLNLYINNCTNTASTIRGVQGNTGFFIGSWIGNHTYSDSIHLVGFTNASTIQGYSHAGGFFGQTNAPIFFTDCHNTGGITLSGSSSVSYYAGGLVGNFAYPANGSFLPMIKDCSNAGAISAQGGLAGGLAGGVAKGYMIGCSNSGNVISSDGGYVGGFVGQGLNLYINNCTNTASTIRGVQGNTGFFIGSWIGNHTYSDSIHLVGFTNASTIQGYSHAGGFFGQTNAPIFFTDCHNTGGITLSGSSSVSYYAGGLVGNFAYPANGSFLPMIKDCSNAGAISAQGGLAGGLAGGVAKGYMIGCSNSGNVISSDGGYVGGFVGQGLNLYINNCTNTASTIRGVQGNTGFFIGSWIGNHTYSDSIHLVGFTNASTIQGYSHAGGFFGQTNAPIFFTDCHNTGGITLSGSSSVSYYAGGLVGNFAYPANGSFLPMIMDCSNSGAISAQAGFAGGILGGVIKCQLYNCSNSANITSSNGGNLGGIIGSLSNSSTVQTAIISKSTNSGLISGSLNDNLGGIIGVMTRGEVTYSSNTGNVSGRTNVGGIVGNGTRTLVYRTFNTGSVTASTNYAGGLSGIIQTVSSLEESYNTGAIRANNYVGGVSGNIGATSSVKNCYNHGSVRGDTRYSGGLVGLLSGANIFHSYSIATFSGSTTDRNGTVGLNSSGTSTNTYWNSQISGVTTTPTGTGLDRNTTQMQTQSNYVDWNFHTIWHLDSCATANGYPILRWQLVDFDDTEAPTTGLGTSAAPFQVSKLEQIYWIVTDRKNWDKHYIQTADIDLTLTPQVCGYAYTPIGDRQDAFSGSYNGQHFKIQNLTIDVQTDAFPDLGMFGVSSGTIQNVLIEDVDIKGGSRIGAHCLVTKLMDW